MKTGVILVTLGGPRSLEEVPEFIKRFIGRELPPPALKGVIDRYRQIGGFSPLCRITEDPETTTAMVSKLIGKADLARKEMRPPFVEGPNDADITFVSWGSSYGPVHEAMDMLNERGIAANMAHFVDLWPFPAEEACKALSGARKLVDVEGNAMAQFAFLLHAYAGIGVDQKILKFDGRAFTPDYILGRLEVK